MIGGEIFLEIMYISRCFVVDIHDFYKSFEVFFSENVFDEYDELSIGEALVCHYYYMLVLTSKLFEFLKFSDKFFFCMFYIFP